MNKLQKLVPTWLRGIAITLIVTPFILYQILSSDYAWIGILFGLIMLGIVFPVSLLVHVLNKKSIMIGTNSGIGKSTNKSLVTAADAFVRIFIAFMSIAIFFLLGINVAKDSFYLLNNAPIKFEAQVIEQRTNIPGLLVSMKFIKVKNSETEKVDQLTSMFVYEKYVNGESYLFTLLPYSNKIIKVEEVN